MHAITCRRKRPLVDTMPPQCLSWDLGKVARFGFCLGCILMMNMAKLHVTVLSYRKELHLHVVAFMMRERTRMFYGLIHKPRPLESFKYINTDLTRLIFYPLLCKIHCETKASKIDFCSLSSPPKASLLTPGDRRFSNFLCPFEKHVYFFLSFFSWVQWNQKVPWACIEILVWYFRCANFIGSKIQLYCIVVGSWRISTAKLSHGWRLGIIPPSFSFSSHFVRVT